MAQYRRGSVERPNTYTYIYTSTRFPGLAFFCLSADAGQVECGLSWSLSPAAPLLTQVSANVSPLDGPQEIETQSCKLTCLTKTLTRGGGGGGGGGGVVHEKEAMKRSRWTMHIHIHIHIHTVR